MEGLLDTYEKFQNVSGMTERAMNEIRKSFGFLIDRIKQAGILILSFVGEALAESLTDIGEKVLEIAMGVGEWVKRNHKLIETTAKLIFVIFKLGITLLVLGKALAIIAGIIAVITGPGGLIWLTLGLASATAATALLHGALEAVKRELTSIALQGEKARKATAKLGSDSKIVAKDITILQESLAKLDKVRKERAVMRDWFSVTARTVVETQREMDRLEKKIKSIKEEETGIRGRIGRVLGWEQERIWGEGTKKRLYAVREEIEGLRIKLRVHQRAIQQERARYSAQEEQMRYVKMLQIYEDNIAKAKEKETKELGKQVELMEKLQKTLSESRRGYFLGYYRTPILAYATQTTEANMLLSEISINTGEDGAIVKAIQEKVRMGD